MVTMTRRKDIYEIGETPPLGHVPEGMYAQVIRQERFGEPRRAFQVEQVAVPELAPDEALVYVMAAGINYNNVWAALGSPVDVIKSRAKDPHFPDDSGFHIGGSDASGVVYAVGEDVTDLKVGDEVVVGVNRYRGQDDDAKLIFRVDPHLAAAQRERLATARRTRDPQAVAQSLAALRTAAEGTDNLMPPIMRAVKSYATLGEICGVMRDVFGDYKPPTAV